MTACPRELGQHRRGVPHDPEGPARLLRPADRDLGDPVAERPGEAEHLDVEAETVRPRQAEENLRLGVPERLEAALGVGEVEGDQRAGELVERPAAQAAGGDAVGASAEPARAERHLGVLQRRQQQRQVGDVGGQVGVHEHDGLADGGGHPDPDRGALPVVPRESDHPAVRHVTQQLGGYSGGVVGAAVVDDDQLGTRKATQDVREDRERPWKPAGLVECRNHDAHGHPVQVPPHAAPTPCDWRLPAVARIVPSCYLPRNIVQGRVRRSGTLLTCPTPTRWTS